MRRLVCVIEGHGGGEAAPVLCNRVMRTLLGVDDWHVDQDPVCWSRSLLVDEKAPSPRRPPNLDPRGLPRALAAARPPTPGGIPAPCDADDDCPATWGPKLPQTAPASTGSVIVRGVMASREYESWLLWSFLDAERASVKALNPEQSPRDAKKALERLVPGDTPTTHQLEQTSKLDLAAVWGRSDSFDKFVRSIAALLQVAPPARPQGAAEKGAALPPAGASPGHSPRGRATKSRR